ncbi:hypothetical protein V6Z12_D09G000300 [Gossypium hirsutum]
MVRIAGCFIFCCAVGVLAFQQYLVTKVVRQSKLDHDAILMDMMGSKPCKNFKDPRFLFKYDVCWAKDKEARQIINRIWTENNGDILNKMDKVRD